MGLSFTSYLTHDLNFIHHSLRLVTSNMLVFFSRSSSSLRGKSARESSYPPVPWKDAKRPMPAASIESPR